jgi:hypothetical protein
MIQGMSQPSPREAICLWRRADHHQLRDMAALSEGLLGSRKRRLWTTYRELHEHLTARLTQLERQLGQSKTNRWRAWLHRRERRLRWQIWHTMSRDYLCIMSRPKPSISVRRIGPRDRPPTVQGWPGYAISSTSYWHTPQAYSRCFAFKRTALSGACSTILTRSQKHYCGAWLPAGVKIVCPAHQGDAQAV